MLSHRVIITAFALFIATLINAQTTNQHVVMRGETFASIANKYGITEQQLKNANSAHSTCYVGLKLTIPAAKEKKSIAATSPAETKQGATTTSQTSNAISSKTYAKENNKAAKKEKRREFWEKFRDALDATSETMLTMSERFYQMGRNAYTYTPNVTVQAPNANLNGVSVQNHSTPSLSQPSAQFNLGIEYLQSQNYSEAAKWFRKAAEQGLAQAQYNLGVCYDNGWGISQNYSEAVKWYRKAAEQGLAEAQCNLGVCYYKGEGVSQNYNEALKWCQKAVEQGYGKASFMVGFIKAKLK
ncbi:MAG: SEL1-like repeat protein [Prevotella sp.]|nr:SEL1-like repeat protein [Prevotella sp.]